MARADERGSDGGVSAAGTGQFTAPGWVRDENGALRRETIHRMGRRLPDFDYSSRRIYEITVVLEERRAVLGRLVKLSAGLSDLGPDGRGCELGQGWAVEPSEWGEVVLNCWREIEARWPQVSLIEAQLMPDHFHGVLFVKEALPKGKSLGSIIGGFKAGCTKGWREIAAALSGAGPDGSARSPTGGRVPHWAEGYVDTILFGRGQLEKMVNYLRDNPRRLGVKREHPELFKVARDLEVSLGPAGVGHFAAIGNHFLLARHELRQVQVSRRFFAYRRDARGKILRGEPPAVSTAEFAAKLADALAAAKRGAVLVSPCVSEGEREIGRQVFAAGLGLALEHIVGVLCDKRRREERERSDEQNYKCNSGVDREHEADRSENRRYSREELSESHQKSVGKGIGVGNHTADNLARRMRIEI